MPGKMIIFEPLKITNTNTMFTEKDLAQISAHGLAVSDVEVQLKNFREGFPFLNISRAASVGDGIVVVGDEVPTLEARYDEALRKIKTVKFVPASGAATRMFKALFEFVNEGKRNSEVDTVVNNVERFAFGDRLRTLAPKGSEDHRVISALIGDGLNYGTCPKALILFHKYGKETRTALEEHLCEGAAYASCNGTVHIHFTVSPEHVAGFKNLLGEVLPRYEERFGVKYDVGMSVQKSSTDTVAVNPDNTLFRNPDGSLLFRPAGHGALIANLNDMDADVVFVKNIDNVTTDSQRGDTIRYKKVLGGMLVTLQEQVFRFMRVLSAGEADEAILADAVRFVEEKLCVKLPEGFARCTMAERVRRLETILDRPIRVCGMVRNEGEPGGGPFWVANADGTESLQIAESSQIAPEDKGIMQYATHFNPVDLVCGIKRFNGQKFDLTRFVDPATGFISSKSKDGKELKAQELPGLWNGAMARWNTVFVEVPITTFSPVKVVTDLLRVQHQE